MQQIRLYFKESFNELVNHVTWPTWASLISTTVLVLVSMLILSVIIFLMDLVAKQFTALLYSINL